MNAHFFAILESIRADLSAAWGSGTDDPTPAQDEVLESAADDLDAFLTELADTARQAYDLEVDRAVGVVFEAISDMVADAQLAPMPEEDAGVVEWVERARDAGLRGYVLRAARESVD